jgi:transcription factor SPN1
MLTILPGRRRALDRKMDDALRSNKPARRKGGGIDLEAAGDAELEEMRQRMASACQADSEARNEGRVATQKLKLLPDVVALLNRNTLRSSVIDPDINILEAVRFFLEPSDTDAALPSSRTST